MRQNKASRFRIMLTRTARKFEGVSEPVAACDAEIDYDHEHRDAEHEHEHESQTEEPPAPCG